MKIKKLASMSIILVVFFLCTFCVQAQENYTVNLGDITDNAKEGDASVGNGGAYLSMSNNGSTSAILLGTIDLSKFSALEITYGTDESKRFGETTEHYIALTTDGVPAGSNIIAQTTDRLEPSTNGSWTKVKATIDLSEKKDTSSVWIAYNLGDGGNSGSISITEIVFIADNSGSTEPPVYIGDGNDYTVAISELDTGNAIGSTTIGSDASYYLSIGNGGNSGAIKLGTFDLSKFASVSITYGSDENALFAEGNDTYLALTKNGEINSGTIAKTVQLQNPPSVAWSPVTVTISLNDIDHKGDVWINYNLEDINGRKDSIAIRSIVFTAAETEEPSPSTSDVSSFGVLSLLIFCVCALTLCRKKEYNERYN